MSRKEVLRPGNAGCQSAAFGRCAECTLAGNTTLTAIAKRTITQVRGRLPRTTGQRPVLPRNRSTP